MVKVDASVARTICEQSQQKFKSITRPTDGEGRGGQPAHRDNGVGHKLWRTPPPTALVPTLPRKHLTPFDPIITPLFLAAGCTPMMWRAAEPSRCTPGGIAVSFFEVEQGHFGSYDEKCNDCRQYAWYRLSEQIHRDKGVGHGSRGSTHR